MNMNKMILSALALTALAITGCKANKTTAPTSGVGAPSTLHTQGPNILNEKNEEIRLIGMNVPGLEWSVNGEGGSVLRNLDSALEQPINFVRLPMNAEFWLGLAPEQNGDPTNYRQLVNKAVKKCEQKSVYIALDLHWSDPFEKLS